MITASGKGQEFLCIQKKLPKNLVLSLGLSARTFDDSVVMARAGTDPEDLLAFSEEDEDWSDLEGVSLSLEVCLDYNGARPFAFPSGTSRVLGGSTGAPTSTAGATVHKIDSSFRFGPLNPGYVGFGTFDPWGSSVPGGYPPGSSGTTRRSSRASFVRTTSRGVRGNSRTLRENGGAAGGRTESSLDPGDHHPPNRTARPLDDFRASVLMDTRAAYYGRAPPGASVQSFFYPRPTLFAKNGTVYRCAGVLGLLIVGAVSCWVIMKQVVRLEAEIDAALMERARADGYYRDAESGGPRAEMLSSSRISETREWGPAPSSEPLEPSTSMLNGSRTSNILMEGSNNSKNYSDHAAGEGSWRSDENGGRRPPENLVAAVVPAPFHTGTIRRQTLVVTNKSFFLEAATIYWVEWVGFFVVTKVFVLLGLGRWVFPEISKRSGSLSRGFITSADLVLIFLCWVLVLI